MKKFLIILITVLILVGAGVGGFYIHDNRENLKSWFVGEKVVTNKTANELREELETVKSELAFEQSKSANYVNQLTEKQQENAKLNEQITQLTAKISENEKTITQLKQNAEQNSGEISRLQSENEQLKTDKNGLQQTVNENAKTIENLQSQIANKDSRISELEQQVSQLQEQLNSSVTSDLAQKIIDRSITEIKASDLEGVTKIGEYVFAYCKDLVSVELPDTVTDIGFLAFGYCENLKTVKLSSNITSIGNQAFEHCSNLSNIDFPSTGKLISIGTCAFDSCESFTNIILPEGLVTIGWRAFYYCHNLQSIVIPSTVTTIGEQNFYFGYPSKLKVYLKSSSIYSQITSELDCGYLLSDGYYRHELFVLKSIVDDPSNTNEYLNNESNYTKTIEGEYYVYTKVA